MDTHQLANDLAALHAAVDAAKPGFQFSIGPDGLLLSMDAKVLAIVGMIVAAIVLLCIARDAWRATQ